MEGWLTTSHLREKEKRCASCLKPFSGEEMLNIKSDGDVVVKYVECLGCETVIVLDAARSN